MYCMRKQDKAWWGSRQAPLLHSHCVNFYLKVIALSSCPAFITDRLYPGCISEVNPFSLSCFGHNVLTGVTGYQPQHSLRIQNRMSVTSENWLRYLKININELAHISLSIVSHLSFLYTLQCPLDIFLSIIFPADPCCTSSLIFC